MAKAKYRLQVVLDIRERAKKDAAEAVALCRRKIADAEEELERRKKAVEESREKQEKEKDKMLSEMRGGVLAKQIMAHKGYLGRLKDEEEFLAEKVEEQRRTLAKANQELEKALEKLTEASKELKVIETHKEKWQTALRKELEKKEEKMNDEIGAILYQRRLKP